MAGFPPNRRQGHGRYGPGRCTKDNPRQRAEALPRTLEAAKIATHGELRAMAATSLRPNKRLPRREMRAFDILLISTTSGENQNMGTRDLIKLGVLALTPSTDGIS